MALVRQCVCAPVCTAVRVACLQKARKAKERSSLPSPGLRSMMSGFFLGAYLVFLTFVLRAHTIATYHTHSRSQGRVCELESIC